MPLRPSLTLSPKFIKIILEQLREVISWRVTHIMVLKTYLYIPSHNTSKCIGTIASQID